jgi:hypothetical protein
VAESTVRQRLNCNLRQTESASKISITVDQG